MGFDIARFIKDFGAIILAFITLVAPAILYFISVYNWRQDKIKKVSRIVSKSERILMSSRLYITPKCQIEAPHNDNTIDKSIQEPILEKIKRDIFNKNDDKKRYMILGGSGMGKSIFSASLYLSIIKRYWFRKCPFPIFILPLMDPEIISDLKELRKKYEENVDNAVIILDGLDENSDAAHDYISFLEKLEKVTKEFRIVVITCRTQLFPDKEHEPGRTKITITGGNRKVIEYDKYYISPFDQKDTEKYLKYKYKNDKRKYNEALKVIKLLDKSKDVISRPMVLNFIDDLLKLSKKSEISSVDIYFSIIDGWFDREAKINDKIDRILFYSFYKILSLRIYEEYMIRKKTYIPFSEFKRILNDNGNMSTYTFQVRSLVNRNDDGNIKFSHLSFLEFFLAINAIEHPEKSFSAYGFSNVVTFFNDIYIRYLNGIPTKHVLYPNSSEFNVPETFDSQNMRIMFKITNDIIQDGSYSQEKLLIDLSDLWNEFIGRLSNQLLYYDNHIIINKRVIALNNEKYLNQETPEDIQKEYIESANESIQVTNKTTSSIYNNYLYFLNLLQDLFIENVDSSVDTDILKPIEVQYNTIKEINAHYYSVVDRVERGKVFVDDLRKRRSKTKLIMYPSILELDPSQSYLKSYLSISKDCFIGCGFNDDKEIIELIKNVKEKGISRIYIYCESKAINHPVRLISIFSNYCIDEKDFFVMAITINSKKIYYLVTNRTKYLSKKSIESCLLNMLKAKTQRKTFK